MATEPNQQQRASGLRGNVGFRRKALVHRPQLKLEPGNEYYVIFDGAIYVGKPIESGTESKKEPPHLAHVLFLGYTASDGQYVNGRGAEAVIILPKLRRDALTEAYPGDAYVRKAFAFEFHKHANPDKRYNVLTTLQEIEPSEAQQVGAEKPAEVGKRK